MVRTFQTEGLILGTNRIGEIHKGIQLFTREQGILHLIAHGAYKTKGRMRALSETFSHITAFVYHDPVRDSYKLTDAEAISVWSSFRSSIAKFYAASLFAEMAVKSYAGGASNAELYDLVLEAYKTLEQIELQHVRKVIIRFCLSFLEITGHTIQTEECRICGRILGIAEELYYSRTGHGFVCASCCQETRLVFSPQARNYVQDTASLPFDEAVRVQLDRSGAATFSTLLLMLVQEALEKELVTLASTGVDW
ncbi:MAG: DNA repair protein RecO [Spirochaetaceae bacterium]|nr:MAG: DNA repair protein RecO [Spirochaetaceae bacterium]